jgi:hypothetical protein
MTSLTEHYNAMAGDSRKLESQAGQLRQDASRLRLAVSNMNAAIEQFSVNGPLAVLRRSADDIRVNGVRMPVRQGLRLAAE